MARISISVIGGTDEEIETYLESLTKGCTVRKETDGFYYLQSDETGEDKLMEPLPE